jgi:putative hydrolase of the HAD superfamily
MRMTPIEAVLFDYGRTLVTFTYPRSELEGVLERFRPAIADALGGVLAPAAADLMRLVVEPLEALVDDPGEDEVSYLAVYRAAWLRAGLELPDSLLYEILDAEQLVWDRAATVSVDALPLLSWLGVRGIKRAICSNAPFPPEMMRRQVDGNGVGELVEAAVFSSQVGKRKPAAEIYRAALDSLGVDPERALFVGDRVREDYDGPRALGMSAVICTAHATDAPPPGVATIGSLSDLPGIL